MVGKTLGEMRILSPSSRLNSTDHLENVLGKPASPWRVTDEFAEYLKKRQRIVKENFINSDCQEENADTLCYTPSRFVHKNSGKINILIPSKVVTTTPRTHHDEYDFTLQGDSGSVRKKLDNINNTNSLKEATQVKINDAERDDSFVYVNRRFLYKKQDNINIPNSFGSEQEKRMSDDCFDITRREGNKSSFVTHPQCVREKSLNVVQLNFKNQEQHIGVGEIEENDFYKDHTYAIRKQSQTVLEFTTLEKEQCMESSTEIGNHSKTGFNYFPNIDSLIKG